MSFIGCWNTSQDFTGKHQGVLKEGSITIKSFSLPHLDTDEEVILYAKQLSQSHNYFLLSISELKGQGPVFDKRKVYSNI